MARILITMPVEAEAQAEFQARHQVTVCARPNRAELAAAIQNYDAIVSMLGDRFDAELLAQAQGLKIIANHAVGYENIDVDAASRAQIWVTNTPDVLNQATAEMAWALLLTLARRVGEGDALVRSGQWGGWEPTQLLGTAIGGKTLGIVGAGRIGQCFGRMASGFGVDLVYHNRRPDSSFEAETGARYLDLDTLLKTADLISMHLPSTPETHHILNQERLGLLKPSALLVNTGRGNAIDEVALVEALTAGRLGGAALDVYEFEPQVTPQLLALSNVVLAPHLGSATRETRRDMARICLRNIEAALAGETPPQALNQISG